MTPDATGSTKTFSTLDVDAVGDIKTFYTGADSVGYRKRTNGGIMNTVNGVVVTF